MSKAFFTFILVATISPHTLLIPSAPPPEAFRVFKQSPAPGPRITPYLKYQTEQAWREDENRVREWEGIRNEKDVFQLQRVLRTKLLEMIGGLPDRKTPLNPVVTGTIQMDDFHIEKLIFESLPGVYVSALLYVPDDKHGSHPAVLVEN